MTKIFDVVAIGNAIVDVIAPVGDDFLARQGLAKGSMSLIDERQAEHLTQEMRGGEVSSGGSAGNTVAGVASLGGRAAYIGKVRDDDLGRLFSKDLKAIGVHFDTAPATKGPSTARCLVAVTPDGERTMSTYLGACVNLDEADVDEATIQSAQIFYFEGYLWDPPQAIAAFRKAARIARANGAKVAITLSDAFCVERHRDAFLKLIQDQEIDILFANAHELVALYQMRDFDEAAKRLAKEKNLSFVTRSEKGCIVVENGAVSSIAAAPIQRLIDATGAGDLFAAGVLYGLSQGFDAQKSARIGAAAASEVIQHFGARPHIKLSESLDIQKI